MKIKALLSFVGAVDMNMGEVREVDDKLASSLISCGYAAVESPSALASEDKSSSSETPANVTENENANSDDPTEKAVGDADENIGDNSRKRKKSAKD